MILRVFMLAAGLALAGQAFGDWAEVGDAGDAPIGAAQGTGTGMLSTITGAMTSGGDGWQPGDDHVDAYLIKVTDPAQFFATTDPGLGGSFIGEDGFEDDSRLWLYDSSGNLVYANDDAPPVGTSDSLESFIADPAVYTGSYGGVTFNGPGTTVAGGVYTLVVSYYDNNVWDAGGVDTVAFVSDFDALHGPNPAAGPGVSWENPGDSFDTGWTYTVSLRGAMGVPEPTSVALLCLAGLLGFRRR